MRVGPYIIARRYKYADVEHLAQALDGIRQRRGPFAVVIHGAARGADTMAGEWAATRAIPVQEFPAQWEAFENPRSAGPIRNQQMLTEGKPDLVIAFPGARGTAHMVRLAQEAGVEVIEEPDDNRAKADCAGPPGQAPGARQVSACRFPCRTRWPRPGRPRAPSDRLFQLWRHEMPPPSGQRRSGSRLRRAAA